MEMFSALLALCEENLSVVGGSHKGPVIQVFYVFYVSLNKLFNKQ